MRTIFEALRDSSRALSLILAATTLVSARTLAETQAPATAASATLPAGATIKSGVLLDKGEEVVLSAKDADYTLSNGKAVLDSIKERNFPVHLETLRLQGAGEHYLKVKSLSPRSTGQWKEARKLMGSGAEKPLLKEINAAVESVAEKAMANITLPANQQDWKGLLEEYDATRASIAKTYPAVKDASTRGALARLNSNLANEQRSFLYNKRAASATAGEAEKFVEGLSVVEKRFYRLNDNYRPEIYPMISDRSASCVAIARKTGGSIPLGSGVIIGEDLVLTCAHNIDNGGATSFETSEYVVWSDYEDRRHGAPPVNTICECMEIWRGEGLDYVLLRIRRADNKQPLGRPALALNKGRVPRWTPIFLVGYPEGNRRTVHDSSWVLFPHRLINNTEWGEVEAAITEEYLEEQTNPDSAIRNARAAEKARDFMTSRYGEFSSSGANQYVLRRDGAEYIGAECDTFRGDSGAPALLREDGTVVGILFKGLSDYGAAANTEERNPISSRPGAKFHERILPTALIVSDLDARFPHWRTFGVTVQ